MSRGAVRHVGVIGAGLAGLAAALAALAAGLRVDVFEASPAPAELPAHIDVVPNLLRDLAGLGLAETCVRRGFPYHQLAWFDADGRRHAEIPMPRLAPEGLPAALGMAYGELLAVMREAALARGARLHPATAVRDVRDGGTLLSEDGRRHAVDLALIASGTALPLLASEPARPMALETLPQQWCHALLPRPVGLEHAAFVLGRGTTKLMLVPVDARRAGVAVMQAPGADTRAPAIRASLAGQGALMRQVAAHWRDDTPTIVRPVCSGLLDGPWHAQGVLRIGHAAHVLPPQFGQAAAQAVEDAVVLGALWRARLPRDELLDRFMARRGERARSVHAVALQAARWDLQPVAGTDWSLLAQRLAPLVAEPA